MYMGNITKNSNIAHIVTTLVKADNNFFRYWLQFIKPLHGLSYKEMEVLASFLRMRYELSKSISNDELLDKVLMNADTKRVIREEHNIAPPYFQVLLAKFRKLGIIKDNKIEKKYIPNLEIDSKEYKLILLFDLKTDDN